MNIGILTWHKALNHGAVLQAYAIQQVLHQVGIESVVLDYQREVIDNRGAFEKLKHISKKLIDGSWKYVKEYRHMDIEKRKVFDAFIKNYLVTGGLCTEQKCSKILIGSDMVFSLNQGFNPYMFGIGLKSEYLFSYAACAGGSETSDFDELGVTNQVSNSLTKFKGLGYRDEGTAKLIRGLTGRDDIAYNIDPVLLYRFTDERRNWKEKRWDKRAPYLLLYSYHENMNDINEVKIIRKYARDNNLKIISCGYFHAWCDENVNADPREFIELFSNARVVLTDTFHGTVFSLIFHKNFATIIRGNGFKIKDLLERCDMNKRILSDASELDKILSRPISYTSFDLWLAEQRKVSLEYLHSQLLS